SPPRSIRRSRRSRKSTGSTPKSCASASIGRTSRERKRWAYNRVGPRALGILYRQESTGVHAGAGIGLQHPPITQMPLNSDASAGSIQMPPSHGPRVAREDAPFTIAEAKARLARALGVPEASIKISIEVSAMVGTGTHPQERALRGVHARACG